jgi:DHA1 family inner membrane transport protein
MGLLPEVAADLRVTIPDAGMLVSGYALGVALGGPLLALATVNLPRKGTLASLLFLFILGNLGCALAPNYGLLMLSRVLTAFSHAAFFGIGAVVATGLVAPSKRAQAIALMVSGLTVANVLGVPLGTWLGQAAGWRATFWGVTILGVIAAAAVLRWIPRQEPGAKQGLKQELRALRSVPVWLTLLTSMLASVSMFVFFTYIAPILRDITGIPPQQVGTVLLLCGIGLTIGNFAGARLADWKMLPSLTGVFVALVGILSVLSLVIRLPIATVVVLCVWGACAFGAGTILQSLVVSKAQEGPNLASTLNISAFNLGNAIGAGIGGWAIDRGLSLANVPWLAVVPAAMAAGVTLLLRYQPLQIMPATGRSRIDMVLEQARVDGELDEGIRRD